MLRSTLVKCGALVVFLSTVSFLYLIRERYPEVLFIHKRLTSLRRVATAEGKTYVITVIKNDRYEYYPEDELLKALSLNCSFNRDLNDKDGVQLPNGSMLDMSSYKRHKREQFIRKFSNPTDKMFVRPTVKPQQKQLGPVPWKILWNPREIMNRTENILEMMKEKKRCLAFGDDDILKIPAVQKELKQTTYKIPNLVHFIWFGCNRFRVDHYMALVGALRYQKPRLILFHTNCEPSTEYWAAIRIIAGKKLKVIRRSPPQSIWGLEIKLVEHQADVARLQLMLEVGGIYMDTDSIIIKSLKRFRKEDAVLGQETRTAVASGMILAHRNSWFMHRWFWEYRYYRSNIWGHNSVVTAWALMRRFPKQVHIERNSFCRPNWSELNLLYHELMNWNSNFIIHLYSRFLPMFDTERERPLKELAVLNTTYGEIARHVIWGNRTVRDVTDWIVTCDLKQILIDAKP